ncbi:sulfotransferase family protein [Vannielia litorea]|uniref:Sulfotransferase family protein n=1 Tax=Vannielia litorea TaxID=1217970 RepID=A0A1N6GW97_9RHOB|nr:sulfotransferase [Vannielia litorea]SIO11861.1 Sulfotransferase family protein [Vannielia litorea]
MRLPGFLIIGAMKAGTTSLYDDLSRVPGLYLPPEKEPEDLADPDVETPAGRAAYAARFAAAPAGALCGEASTAYAKRPTHEGVAERAARVLGPGLRIIYLTRDPVRRIVSQYHHLHGLGLETRPLNDAVLADETYVAYSRYDWQLAPWRASFGPAQVLVIRFEEYIARRAETLQTVCGFLGVAAPRATPASHRNASAGKRIVRPGSPWSRIAHSHLYLYRIKPHLPTGLRDRLKTLLLPATAPLTEPLTPATRAELERRLGTEAPRAHAATADVNGAPMPGKRAP